MYRLAQKIDSSTLLAIAKQLFSTMLANGYTSVVEFHYLHHQGSGLPYEKSTELALVLSEAAEATGIQLTLVPVFYNKGGFQEEIKKGQKRFFMKNLEDYQEYVSQLQSQALGKFKVGHGLHSLRAADIEDAKVLLSSSMSNGPIHLHISEQIKEVEEFKKLYGKRPVQWILEEFDDTKPLNLVHSTHIDHNETIELAKSKHCVVICPSTEANLGDGIFPLKEFEKLGGTWSIGSDSHIKVNPFQELELLDYGQRLATQSRNPLLHGSNLNTGDLLFRKSQEGSEISSHYSGFLDIGSCLTGVKIDEHHPHLLSKGIDHILSTSIFCFENDLISAVYVKGNKVAENGRHVNYVEIKEEYRDSIQNLLSNGLNS